MHSAIEILSFKFFGSAITYYGKFLMFKYGSGSIPVIIGYGVVLIGGVYGGLGGLRGSGMLIGYYCFWSNSIAFIRLTISYLAIV